MCVCVRMCGWRRVVCVSKKMFAFSAAADALFLSLSLSLFRLKCSWSILSDQFQMKRKEISTRTSSSL